MPWHRVVGSDGKLQGEGGPLGALQLQKLREEGARPREGECASRGRRTAGRRGQCCPLAMPLRCAARPASCRGRKRQARLQISGRFSCRPRARPLDPPCLAPPRCCAQARAWASGPSGWGRTWWGPTPLRLSGLCTPTWTTRASRWAAVHAVLCCAMLCPLCCAVLWCTLCCAWSAVLLARAAAFAAVRGSAPSLPSRR